MDIELICNNCNEKFVVPYKQRNKKFCTQSCFFEYGKKNKTIGKKIDQTIRETRCCVECGNTFTAKIKQVKKLCSDECRKKWAEKPENKATRLENGKITNLKKYGVDSLFKTEEYKKNVKNYIKIKHGVETPMHKKEFVDKLKNTIKEKHLKKLLPKLEDSNLELLSDYSTNKSGNTSISYHFKCNSCDNIFSSTLLGVGKIPICRKCFPINKNSSLEISIKDFLNEHNITHIDGDKKILGGKEIDIFLPDYNIGIEVNGNYYHSELNGDKDKNYHVNKTILAHKKNIKLIHIFEDEIIKKSNIVFSRLGNFLNLNKKIYARKCTIKEIDKSTAEIFLNTNHIQGTCVDKHRYGLFYMDDLVSIITFSKKRRVLGNKTTIGEDYELLRFCNKLNHNVIGGFSKLLKNFIKIHKPNKIETYADIRWSGLDYKNTVYEKNGFNYLNTTKPNYWYLNLSVNNNRLHRYNFRKDVLVKEGFDKHKTEQQIMFERGFDRIWDCGSMKFELYLDKMDF